MKLYLESTKGTDTRFEVVSYDPETKKGRIIGTLGKEFSADMSKENLLKTGYRVIKVADECEAV
jgi:hypothetical protein